MVNGKPVMNTTPTTRTVWEKERVPFELQVDLYPFKNNALTLGAFWSREDELRETYCIATDVPGRHTPALSRETANPGHRVALHCRRLVEKAHAPSTL
jgi:hypothetical protein